MNTKKQGDIGLGLAIAYFSVKGYTVSIPLTDSQDYDLVVDIEGKLERVQVKRTSYKRNNSFSVSLTIKGGNRSGTGKIKLFDKSKVDYVFIATSDNECYFIPVTSIKTKSTIQLNDQYDVFKVNTL